MVIISKAEFARRCGVSKPTVFAWIKQNKDGIRSFVDPNGKKGIDEKIFNADPWKEMDNAPKAEDPVEKLKKELDAVRSENEKFRQDREEQARLTDDLLRRLDDTQKERDQLRSDLDDAEKKAEGFLKDIEGLQKMLNDLRNQLTEARHQNELQQKDIANLSDKVAERDVQLAKVERDCDARIRDKDAEIARQYQTQFLIAAAKKPLGQRLKEFFTGSKTTGQQNTPGQ